MKKLLGVGIAFFGYIWHGGQGTSTDGVTEPGQQWTVPPSAEELPYHEIMDKYYQPENYRWHKAARVPYLSIDNAGSENDIFISYDDEESCKEKIAYVKKKGLGGVMIFELGSGWRPGALIPDSLLKTIKKSVGNPHEPVPSDKQ